ncbi:hypothetical protein GQ607_015908 [Colletotrichum asianum]|uniref:Uncharacterized protein n=1 Tax=Colletotrichum asianum TaxID=702518 RepID=A0A8H3VXP4_9PEZI|nr:hypothetical protein GQ607_015908 [Colletotrichum asianum]
MFTTPSAGMFGPATIDPTIGPTIGPTVGPALLDPSIHPPTARRSGFADVALEVNAPRSHRNTLIIAVQCNSIAPQRPAAPSSAQQRRKQTCQVQSILKPLRVS